MPSFLRGLRGAFFALGGAFAVFLLIVVLPFLATLIAQRDDIADSKAQIETAQAELALKPELEEQFRALSASAATVPGLLSANTAALAQAQLQSDMKSIIDANGGVLLSAQILPPVTMRGFDVVAIQYDLTLPLSRLRSLLYAVETHTPYFFIDEADVQMPPNWRPDNPQMSDPTLEVRWTVHAYRWSGNR
ncbi:MAG: type II secretion system protein GspM [Rhizomicrobium sp.]